MDATHYVVGLCSAIFGGCGTWIVSAYIAWRTQNRADFGDAIAAWERLHASCQEEVKTLRAEVESLRHEVSELRAQLAA